MSRTPLIQDHPSGVARYYLTIGAMPDELTTTAAAKHLDISRPTLMKLINAGEIDAHQVGSHSRLRTADVLAFLRSQPRDEFGVFSPQTRR